MKRASIAALFSLFALCACALPGTAAPSAAECEIAPAVFCDRSAQIAVLAITAAVVALLVVVAISHSAAQKRSHHKIPYAFVVHPQLYRLCKATGCRPAVIKKDNHVVAY